MNQRELWNDRSDLFDIGCLRRRFFLPALLSIRVSCAPVCSSNSHWAVDQFVVHLPGRTRLLLGITAADMGQSLVLHSSDRDAVLAMVET